MSDSTVLELPAGGFAELGLDSRLTDPLAAQGYSQPTPIQREAIPHLVEGKDLVGLAATGTGKTAAFALPLLHRLAQPGAERRRPAALVLVPTRELCMQVAAAVHKYGVPVGITALPVYGGAGFSDQVRAIRRGVDVIVATPGRALDHLRRGTLDLSGVSAVILDEADEMLDMGFADDLEAILQATPAERQTMLFSATMPPRIASIAEKYLSDPVRVQVKAAPVPAGEAPKVRQAIYVVRRDHKEAALARVLEYEAPAAAIVFCRTRTEADGLTDALAVRGHRPEALHGGLTQEHRDRVMGRFRAGTIGVLVATDVAARGLDISHLSHVFNFGVPQAAETYVHRIGRVGRAGREGVAITVLDPREVGVIRQVERQLNRRIEALNVPTAAMLQAKRLDRTRENLRDLIAAGELLEFQRAVAPLLADHPPADVAAAALALLAEKTRIPTEEFDIPTVQPRRPEPAGARGPGGPGAAPRPGPFNRGGPSFGPRPPRRGMARLFVGAGRMDGVGRRDLLDAIGSEVGLTPRDLGDIHTLDRFSTVEVPEPVADQAIEALNGIRLRGRRVEVRHDGRR